MTVDGLGEIRAKNRAATDLPQTKRELDYRQQRDRLAQVLRKVLALPRGACDTPDHAEARKVLVEVFGR